MFKSCICNTVQCICWVQSMDSDNPWIELRPFAQQSMDCLLIPWIEQTEGRKVWIQAIHGLN